MARYRVELTYIWETETNTEEEALNEAFEYVKEYTNDAPSGFVTNLDTGDQMEVS